LHFSESLAKDQAVVEAAQEKIHDVMVEERSRLRDHRGKSIYTTCLAMLSLPLSNSSLVYDHVFYYSVDMTQQCRLLAQNGTANLLHKISAVSHAAFVACPLAYSGVRLSAERSSAFCYHLTGLILASCPFHLFAIDVVIYGFKFLVGYFDRAGIIFSPVYDLFRLLDVFVRVIRRITCRRSWS
jgi:hypothetical protein